MEQVTADCKASKVVVKGKTADPIKVCERIQKKSGRKVEIISPLPKPPEENKVQEAKQEEPPKEEKKDEVYFFQSNLYIYQYIPIVVMVVEIKN